MNIGLTIGQSVSEGLFLSDPQLGPTRLPQLFILTAIATAVSTFVYAAFVDRVRNDTYFEIIHGLALGLLALILVGVGLHWTSAVMMYFGFFYVVTGVFNTHFWNYAADYFDAVEAKRLFPYFPLGNSIGGFIGGSLTDALAEKLPPVVLSLGWVALLIATFVLIRVVSPKLKGWVVMEIEEDDDASLDNLWQGFNFLRRSPMGRWHFVYAMCMIMCLFFLQYLYSDIFARSFPTPEQLTAFIGKFLAITNIVEVMLELTFTPRLIAWAGIGSANLFYPLATLAGFAAMGLHYRLPSAVYSRMDRETFENAVSASCRNLLYSAYPVRLRGRVRAFLEGVVTNLGSVLAGLGLMLILAVVGTEHASRWVILIGSGLTCVFFCVGLMLRRQYFQALVRGLKDWHLDLDEAGSQLDKLKDADIDEQISRLEASLDTSAGLGALLARLLEVLRKRGRIDLIVSRLASPSETLQRAALRSLQGADDVAVIPHLERVLKEASPTVRALALECLQAYRGPTQAEPFLHDESPAVAAVAAALLVRAGTERTESAWRFLERMLVSNEPDMRAHALSVLPLEDPHGQKLFLEHVHDASERVAAVILERLETLRPEVAIEAFVPLLDDPSAALRRAVVGVLGRAQSEAHVALVAARLSDSSFAVRRRAVEVLHAWGGAVIEHVLPRLEVDDTEVIESALAALIGLESPQVRESVRASLSGWLQSAHTSLLLLGCIETDPSTAWVEHDLITIALENHLQRQRRHIFAALAYLENPTVIRNIRRCLDTSNRQARGDALEALSHLGQRSTIAAVLSLFEDGSPTEHLGSSLRLLERERAPHANELAVELSSHPDRWVRAATRHDALLRGWELPGGDGAETEVMADMQNVLFLKKVPMFSEMSLEQLEVISGILTEVQVFKGETVVKEGEIGDELYVVVEGQVSVVKNHRTPHEVALASLRETDYFGEMAVLDQEPRSATVVADADSRLLSLSAERLHDIILQKPEIAFQIFKVLSQRLRKTDKKLGDLVRENNQLRAEVSSDDQLAAQATRKVRKVIE